MRRIIVGFVTLWMCISSAYATPHKHGISHKPIMPRAVERDCLTRALLNEAVGVKSTEARVQLGKLITSRARVHGFPHTVCGVYAQKRITRGRVRCEFSDSCLKRKKAPFRQIDIARARRDAEVAMDLTDRNGPTDYLYFGTGNSCPVVSIRKERKGPFIFCVPKHPT